MNQLHSVLGRLQPAPRAGHWPGHLPDTVAALLGVFERRLGRDEQISLSGRYLVTACEFRAAVANDELPAFLRPGSRRELEAVRRAFAAMGAHSAVECIDVALTDFDWQVMPQPDAASIARLRTGILAFGDEVDRRIARYARLHYGSAAS